MSIKTTHCTKRTNFLAYDIKINQKRHHTLAVTSAVVFPCLLLLTILGLVTTRPLLLSTFSSFEALTGRPFLAIKKKKEVVKYDGNNGIAMIFVA